MRRFRNSQLALGRECGHAYRKAYIDGERGVSTPALRGGQNAHAAIAALVQSLATTGSADLHAIAYRTVRGGSAEYADALGILTLVMEQLGTEWEIEYDGILFVEERLTMRIELRTGEVVEFFGTPDLAERITRRRIRITDYKSHWHPETEHEFRAGPQLPRYALLIHDRFPNIEEFELVKRFVRYRHSKYAQVITAADLPAVREQLISEIEERIALDEAEAWEPTPGSWCPLCTAHASCPVILKYRSQGQPDDLSIEDDDRARVLAGDAIALRAYSSAMQDRLKVYLGADHERGRVDVAGGEYGYQPVDHRSVGVEQLRLAFQQHGLEVGPELLRVDLDQLDRALRRLPEDLVQAVEKITQRWQSSECRFSRTTATPPRQTGEELFDVA